MGEYDQWIANAWETVKNQTRNRRVKKGRKELEIGLRHSLDNIVEDVAFEKAVNKIAKSSHVISWNYMIEAMDPRNHNGGLNSFYSELTRFYTDVIDENTRKGK